MSLRSPVSSPPRRPLSPPSLRDSFAASSALHNLSTTVAAGHSLHNATTHSSPVLAPRSVAAGAFENGNMVDSVANNDVSRVQLLLRLMELEKRVHRVDDRSRLTEESVRAKLTELHSATNLAADRSTTFLARLSEVELAAREAEIGVQALDQRMSVDSDALTMLRAQVQQWKEESKKELREEFTRNINLRNATHHQELVSLMDKQQDQSQKILRAQELTTQGFYSKLQTLEAKWSAKFESTESKLETVTSELQSTREKSQQYESQLRTLQSTLDSKLDAHTKEIHKYVQQTLDEKLAPIQQQLLLLTQLHEQQANAHTTQLQTHHTQLQTQTSQITTIHAQLEYASTHLQDKYTSLDQSLLQMKSTQSSLQQNLLNLSQELEKSLREFKSLVPTRVDLTNVETRLTQSVNQLSNVQAGLENHLTQSLAQMDATLHSEFEKFTHSLAQIEAKAQSDISKSTDEWKEQLKELRDEHVAPIVNDVKDIKSTLNHTVTTVEGQRKSIRRSTQALQLFEEQFAALQAKVLVAGEQQVSFTGFAPTSPTFSRRTGGNSIFGLASPPPTSANTLPFQSAFAPQLSLHLSDAAGLKLSPTRHATSSTNGTFVDSLHRTRLASPHFSSTRHRSASPPHSQHGPVAQAAQAFAEEDFVASLLGQAAIRQQ